MTSHIKRATDKKGSEVFSRSERIITDGLDYYYKTRNGGLSTAFETRAAALYDLHKFILAASIENELKEFNDIEAA